MFEPKNRVVIDNSSKTPHNFSPLLSTYLGKRLGLSQQKKKLKSGYLELRFSVHTELTFINPQSA